MALLQIAEPGRAAAPHQHRLAVGIDLGTTNSLVATVRSGLPTVLPDAQGRLLLPSVVHYAADGAVILGHEARQLAAGDPHNTIGSAKRLIGRAPGDVGAAVLPYALEFADEPAAEDLAFESEGVRVLVDARSLPMVDGTQLDWVREGLNEGFKFNNPNASATCGCGESFKV